MNRRVFSVLALALASTSIHAQQDSISQGPMQFQEHHVAFFSGRVRLAGTVTVPGGPGPFPAAVLLSGSGPQDRDCVMSGFPMFHALADILARQGIATLRFDDRGVGLSTGTLVDATIQDLTEDAEAAMRVLRQRPEIDTHRVGLLGHSEGGIVALQAAASDPRTAFAVLLAGPGAPPLENIVAQTESISRANGLTPVQIERETRFEQAVCSALASDSTAEAVKSLFIDKARADIADMSPVMRKALQDVERHGTILWKQYMATMDTPWFRSLLKVDPAAIVNSVSCPVLALFGERDLQVPHGLNRSVFVHAFGDLRCAGSEVHVIPRANHLFQEAVSGSPQEYGSLPKAFAPGLIELLGRWIAAAAGRESN